MMILSILKTELIFYFVLILLVSLSSIEREDLYFDLILFVYTLIILSSFHFFYILPVFGLFTY